MIVAGACGSTHATKTTESQPSIAAIMSYFDQHMANPRLRTCFPAHWSVQTTPVTVTVTGTEASVTQRLNGATYPQWRSIYRCMKHRLHAH